MKISQSIIVLLLFLFGISAQAADISCPSLSLKKVYDINGLCDSKIADTAAARLSKALSDLNDSQISAKNSVIADWTTATRNIVDGIATYSFTYVLYNEDNVKLQETCEATMQVVDASTAKCPTDAIVVKVNGGESGTATSAEAIDVFNSMSAETKGTLHCTESTLYSNISEFTYTSPEGDKIAGITSGASYWVNDNKPSVLYQIAANSEFKNFSTCPAYVKVFDNSTVSCPATTNIELKTDADGAVTLVKANLIKPVAGDANAVSATYTYKKSGDTGDGINLDSDNLPSLTIGNYEVTAIFMREAGEYQTESSATCTQTIEVKDGTVPTCPSKASSKKTFTNDLCAIASAEEAKTQIELLIKADQQQLDNYDPNADLVVSDIDYDNYPLQASEAGTTGTFNYLLSDKAGNSLTCTATLTLIDNEAPVCPDNATVEKVITDGSCAISFEMAPLEATDNCGISVKRWKLEGSNTLKKLTTDVISLSDLSIGSHTISWQFTDNVGLVSNCTQTIDVYEQNPVMVTCDESTKKLSTDGSCNLSHILDSLTVPSATIYDCKTETYVPVSISSYTLNGETLTHDELDAKSFEPGSYTLVTTFMRVENGFYKASSNSCTQTFTVSQKSAPSFDGPISVAKVSLLDSATSKVKVTLNRPNALSCEEVSYAYKLGSGDFVELGEPAFEVLVSKGESVVTVKATNASLKSSETELKLVVEDTLAAGCGTYVWRKSDYDRSQADVKYVGVTEDGENLIKVLKLTINQPSHTDTTAVACASFTWYGTDYTESQDVEKVFTNQFGCDSTVTLHLTINQPSHTDTTAITCGSFTWYGTDYTESQTVEKVFTNQFGCDSTVTLHLTINQPSHTDTTVVACASFTWYGTDYTESQTVEKVFTNQFGCDSTVTLHLTINQPSHTDTTAVVCGSFTWYGTEYTESQNVDRVFSNQFGCDSTVTLHLTINQPSHTDTTAVACSSFIWYGTEYSESQDVEKVFTNQFGCDSTVTLHLTINQPSHTDTIAVVCGSFTWYGTDYTESQDVEKVFTNQFGCDSTVTLHLTINQPNHTDTIVVACSSFTWYGTEYTESQNVDRVFSNQFGCDSTVTLHLTINQPSHTDTTAVACSSFTWYGTEYTESQNVDRVFSNQFGCDSTVTLHLTINQPSHTDTTAVACSSFTWYGTEYTESQNVDRVFSNQFGCDSTVTLHLTINQPSHTDTTAVVCGSFTWYGTDYTESQTVEKVFTNQFGCDSTVTLHLTINQPSHTDTTAVACSSFIWYGTEYTESQTVEKVFTNQFGCDSTVTLHLTINQPNHTDTIAVACDSFSWHGVTYVESGDYTYKGINAVGCDSIETLHLTIFHSTIDTIKVAACNAYSWYDETYTTSGLYLHQMETQNGCDSLEVLDLTIHSSFHDTVSMTVCDSVVWHGQTCTASGTYTDASTSVWGCDSIYVLNLKVNYSKRDTAYIYACDEINWHGTLYKKNAEITDTLLTSTGCDSIVTYHIVLNKSQVTDTVVVACDSFLWRGRTYTESGSYSDSLVSIAGCDSIFTLSLTINRSVKSEETKVVCDSLIWNETTCKQSGDYVAHLETKEGCDSIVTLHLTVNKSVLNKVVVNSCESYMWNDRKITESGVYIDTLAALSGCDSIVELTVTIGQPSETVLYDTILLSDGYHNHGFVISETAIGHVGDYTFHRELTTETGCDSLITLYLNVFKETDTIPEDTTVEPIPEDTIVEPIPEGVATLNRLYCPGDSVTIDFSLIAGSPEKYAINFDKTALAAGMKDIEGDYMGSLPAFVIPEKMPTGNYTASLMLYSKSGQSSEIPLNFQVGYSSDLIVRMWNDVVVCNNKEQDFVAYQWYKADEVVEGATNQYYQDLDGVVGKYGLTVWTTSGDSVSVCPRFFETVSVPFSMTVSPNPVQTDAAFEVRVNGVTESEYAKAKILIYDAHGILCVTSQSVTEVNAFSLSSSGTYTVLLSIDGGNVASEKIVVKP